MAVIFRAWHKYNDFWEWRSTNSTFGTEPELSSTHTNCGYFGILCDNPNTNEYKVKQYITDGNRHNYLRFYIKIIAAPTALNTAVNLNGNGGSNTVAAIRVDTDRSLELWNGSAQIGSNSSALDLNTWYYVEMEVDMTPATGSCVVRGRLNGVEFAASTTETKVAFGRLLAGGGSDATRQWALDDFEIDDAQFPGVFSEPSTSFPANPTDYSQPALPARAGGGFYFNCIDQQVVTKSESWNQDATKRTNEVQACKNLGNITHIAVAVPYDNVTKYTNYVTSIRNLGLKVWHRSHWNSWEKDNSYDSPMARGRYLEETWNFITTNPTLFASGDLFGMAVECNNANDNGNYTFRTPETSGGAFTISKYNQFLKDQVRYANAAFTTAGVTGVYTFPISMSLSLLNLNGQVLDSGDGGNGSGLGDADITSFFGGYLTIDHYMNDAYRDTDSYGSKYNSDLNKIKTAFPNAQLMIGEWGYHTTTSVTDQEQFNVYKDVTDYLQSQTKIVGVSYWVHMGSSTASIFNDSSGTVAAHGRLCRQALRAAFREGNGSVGRAISQTRGVSL